MSRFDITGIADEALNAFWANVYDNLKEHVADLGDLEPGIVDGFTRAAEKAVRAYLLAGRPVNPSFSGTVLISAIDYTVETSDGHVADPNDRVELEMLREHILRLGQGELKVERATETPEIPAGVAWPMNVGDYALPIGWSWVEKDDEAGSCVDDIAAAERMIGAGFGTQWAYIGRRSGTNFGFNVSSLRERCGIAINYPEPKERA
jgi:hypothetical protein